MTLALNLLGVVVGLIAGRVVYVQGYRRGFKAGRR